MCRFLLLGAAALMLALTLARRPTRKAAPSGSKPAKAFAPGPRAAPPEVSQNAASKASLPRQRLLGEQVRLQRMRLRQAVGALHSNTLRPASTASSGATHRKPAELVARPGELPLGVVAGVELRALRRLLELHSAFEMGDEMRNAMRAHDRQRRIEPPFSQRRDLVERALREHGVEPRVDPPAELRPIGREIEARPFSRRQHRRCARAEKRDERTSRTRRRLRARARCAAGRSR